MTIEIHRPELEALIRERMKKWTRLQPHTLIQPPGRF
jgi:hypothetical protein